MCCSLSSVHLCRFQLIPKSLFIFHTVNYSNKFPSKMQLSTPKYSLIFTRKALSYFPGISFIYISSYLITHHHNISKTIASAISELMFCPLLLLSQVLPLSQMHYRLQHCKSYGSGSLPDLLLQQLLQVCVPALQYILSH